MNDFRDTKTLSPASAAASLSGAPQATEPLTAQAVSSTDLSETWAADAQADLEDFIESQGIYIRQ